MKYNGHIHFEDDEKRRIPIDIRDMLVKVLCLKLDPVIEEFHSIIAMVELLDEKRQRKLLERFGELYGDEAKEKHS